MHQRYPLMNLIPLCGYLLGLFTFTASAAPAQVPAKPGSIHIWPANQFEAKWITTPAIDVSVSDMDTSASQIEISESPDFSGSITKNITTDDQIKYVCFLSGTVRKFTPDGKRFIAVDSSNKAGLYDQNTLEKIREFDAILVQQATLTPDGRGVWTVCASRDAQLWDIETGQLLKSFHPVNGWDIYDFEISPDGQWAVMCCEQSKPKIFDLATGTEVRQLDVRLAYAAAFVPATGQLLIGCYDGLRLWDPATGELIHDFSGLGGWIRAVAVSPDSQTAVTGGDDGICRLWSLTTGELLRSFEGHTKPVVGLAFHPDGSRFASRSVNGELFIWKTDRSTILRKLTKLYYYDKYVEFNQDGTRLTARGNFFYSDFNYPFTLAAALQGPRTVYARLRNAAGAGVPTSATIQFDSVPPPKMAVPRIPAQGYTFDDHFTLEWDPIEDPAPGSGIAAYEIVTRTGTFYAGPTYTVAANDHQLTVTGTPGQVLSCTIRAVDQAGLAGEYSDYSADMRLSPADPPTLGGVAVLGEDAATSGWSTILKVDLQLKQASGSPLWVDVATDDMFTSPSVYQYKQVYDKGILNYPLNPGSDGPRTIYVRLRNDAGASPTVSLTRNIDTTPPERPAAPVALDGSPTLNPVRLSWAAATDAGIGVATYECQVTSDTQSGGVTLQRETGGATAMGLIGELGVTYYARVRARDRLGFISEWSEWSAGVTVKINPPTLDGIELLDTEGKQASWSSTRTLEVKLKKVGFSPEYIEVAEDEAMTSRTIIPFTDATWTYRKKLPVNVGAWCPCVNAVALSRDGRLMLTGMNTCAAELWDLQIGKKIRHFSHENAQSLNAVAISPDGRLALTSGNDKQTRLWDVASGTLLHVFSWTTQFATNTTMLTAVFSPDGQYALIGSGREACLWRLSDFAAVHFFRGHGDTVRMVGFSVDGANLFTASLEGLVQVWETKSGKLIRSFIKNGQLSDATLTSGGSTLLTAIDKYLDLWDTRTGACIGNLWTAGANTYARSLLLTEDGTRVVWLDNTAAHRYYWWDLLTGHQTQSFGSLNSICQTALSADEATMVAGDNVGYVSVYGFSFRYALPEGANGPRTVYVRLRNAAGESMLTSATIGLDTTPPLLPGTPVGQVGVDGANPVRFDWTPGADAGSGFDHYEVEMGTAPGSADLFAGIRNAPYVICHVPVGKPVYTRVRAVDRLGQAGAWSAWSAPVTTCVPGVEVHSVNDPATTATWVNSRQCLLTLKRTILPPEKLEIASDASFTSPVTVGLDQLTTKPLRTQYLGSSISDLAFSPDHRRLASAHSDGTLKIRDAATWAEALSFLADESNKSQYENLRTIAFAPDGRTIFSAGVNSELRQWDVATGSLLKTWKGHLKEYYGIFDLAISHDGRLAATGADDYTARLWDLESTASLRTINVGEYVYVTSVALSPDNRLLATAGSDEVIMLWDVASGERVGLIDLQNYNNKTDRLYGLAFSPDGTSLACSQDGEFIGLWDVKTQRLLFMTDTSGGDDTQYNSDGSLLLTLGNGVHLWNAQTGTLLRTFTSASNAIFGPDEQTIISSVSIGMLQEQEMRAQYKVTLPEGADGQHPIWIRLPGSPAGTILTSTTLGIDSVPPQAPGRPRPDASLMLTPAHFTWNAATDVAPSSGISAYEYEVRDEQWEGDTHSSRVTGSSLSITLRGGEHAICRVRAVDAAGNISDWSEWSDPVTISAAAPPTLTGATVYGVDGHLAGVASTNTLRVALDGVRNGPVWVDIGEQPDLSDAVRLPASECCDTSPVMIRGAINAFIRWGLSHDGRRLAVDVIAGIDIWDTWSGAKIGTIANGSGLFSMNNKAFSPDGSRLAYFPDSKNLVIFNLNTWRAETTVNLGGIGGIAFLPDGKQVAVAQRFGVIKFIDVESGKIVRSIQSPKQFTESNYTYGCLDINTDGTHILTSYYDPDSMYYDHSRYDAALWDSSTGNLLNLYKINDWIFDWASLAADEQSIMALGYNYNKTWRQDLSFFDANTGQQIDSIQQVNASPLSADGTKAIISGSAMQARLMDITNRDWLREYTLPMNGLSSLLLSHDGSVAAGLFAPDNRNDQNNAVAVWDARLAYRYTLRSTQPGPRTLYVRAVNLAGASAIVPVTFTFSAQPVTSRQEAILAYLLGQTDRASATDTNEDGQITVADLVTEIRPALDLSGFSAPRPVHIGDTLNVAWSRNYQAGTALRLELWREGFKQADLGTIYSTEYQGTADVTIPQLPAGSGYHLRLISLWLENHPGPAAWVEASGELIIEE